MKKITRLTLALMIPFALYAQSNDEDVSLSLDCEEGKNNTCDPLTDTTGIGLTLKLTVFLEGAYTGNEMSTDLNVQGKIPLNHPFSGSPWNWPGPESVSSIPNDDIVDWVLVDLRDATDPELATFASTCGRKAGFLLKNGKVVDLDGVSPIFVPGSAL